jgi:hypothetical protein
MRLTYAETNKSNKFTSNFPRISKTTTILIIIKGKIYIYIKKKSLPNYQLFTI